MSEVVINFVIKPVSKASNGQKVYRTIRSVAYIVQATNFSDALSKKLNLNYGYLANLFSEVQGMTIEQFIISHKIQMIKELIIYGELTITEIAWKLNYSSVAHLSTQFKKVTGLSPSHFKQLKETRQNPEDAPGILPVAIERSPRPNGIDQPDLVLIKTP